MKRSLLTTGILLSALVGLAACDDQKALLAPEPSVSIVAPMCFGRAATIYPGNPGTGTIVDNGDGSYTITGTASNNVIVGGSGNDVIDAAGGDDRICAGDGDDTILGGAGRDLTDGEGGHDHIDYTASPAAVAVNLTSVGRQTGGHAQDDVIRLVEEITGSAFDDVLRGDATGNTLNGGDGADRITGNAAADELNGGPGADVIVPGAGADVLDGGTEIDFVRYSASPTAIVIDLAAGTGGGAGSDAEGDALSNIENVVGSAFADVIDGDASANALDGAGGDDVLRGAGGNDRLNGRSGADELHGGADNDLVAGDDGDDDLFGDGGDDDLRGGLGTNTVDGGADTDSMISRSCVDIVTNVENYGTACEADATLSTIDAAQATLAADGASATTITVQLKTAGGANVTVGGHVVVLTTDHGTLTDGTTTATAMTALDQGDGTYTLTLNSSNTLETATITGKVDGFAITDDAQVQFTFGDVAGFKVEADGGGTIATQIKNAPFNIDITAIDASGHTVTSFTGTVTLTAEGDVSTSIGTSGSFTAGVLDGQSVSINGSGASVQIRATDGASNTGVSVAFTVDPSDEAPAVTTTTPANGATGFAATGAIDITFSENVTVTAASFDLECPAATDHAFTLSGTGSSYTLTPSTTLPGVTTCSVTVIAANVSDADTDDAPDNLAADYVFSFTTAAVALPDTYTETVLGNVSVNSANAATSFTVLANDQKEGSTSITFAGWNAVAGATENGGNVSVTASGTFTYNPPAGYEGTDRFTYTVTGGSSANVTLTISDMVWFVNNAASACTTVSTGCGRLSNPLSSLAAFHSSNNGAGNNPAAGDALFIYESATSYSGPLTLLADQSVIGQDAASSMTTLGFTPAPSWATLPATNNGNSTYVTINGADGINLSTDNRLFGFSVRTSAGEAISGTGIGTLTLADGTLLPLDVEIRSTGQALSLTTGTIVGNFIEVGSTGGTRNVDLNGISASGLSLGFGALTGGTSGAIRITGGNPLNLTVHGAVQMNANAPLLEVSGGHTGTLAFTATSNLQALGGTGLQFNAAAGTYQFSGTTNLAGGDAAVDITNGSTGTFTFGTGTTITSPSGPAFNLYGSTASVTYSGSITKANAGNMIEIGEHATGTATFQTGTLTAIAGTGLNFSNADGTYNFTGTTNLNGGDAGIDIVSGSGGTFTFGTGTTITNPSGSAFRVNSSSPAVTYSGNITQTNAQLAVDIGTQATGTITFQTGTIAANTSSTGIQLSDVDGTVNFNGTNTLSGGNAGVDVISGSSGTIAFSSGSSIANPSGIAFNVNGSTPASLTYPGTITANTSRAVEILHAVTPTSCGSITFSGNLAGSGASAAGIMVDRCSAGTILFSGSSKVFSTQANAAVSILNNGATVNFTNGNLGITTTSGFGFRALGGGTVTVAGSNNTVATTTGTPVTISSTTIGGANVTFQSVSSVGAANGIVLASTGAGTFSVTGNGGTCTIATPTCTGGLISGSTGNGVSLSGTGPVALTRLRVQSSQGHGIHTTGATSLTLTSSYLQSNGNGDEENGLNALSAAGSILIDNSTFNGAAENLIRVDNTNANLTFTVQNGSVFEYPNPEPSAFRNSAILITPKGSSTITALVNGNTFRNIPVSSFQAAPDLSVTSTSTYTFTNNTLSADVGLNVTCASNAQCRVGNVVAGGTGGTTNFIATGNNFNRVNGDGVFILGANQASTLKFRVDNNIISNAIDDGFVVGLGQNARVIGQFNANNLSNLGADALEVASGEPNTAFGAGSSSDMDLVFTNNTMTNVGTNGALAGSGGPLIARFGDSDQLLCVAFTGNTVNPTPASTGISAYFDGFLGLGGSITMANVGTMTYERAGTGALTEAMVNADNPGVAFAGIIVQGVNLSNGVPCQRPGI